MRPREFDAAKKERLHREAQAREHAAIMEVGPRCPVCGNPTTKRMVEATGTPVHPTC